MGQSVVHLTSYRLGLPKKMRIVLLFALFCMAVLVSAAQQEDQGSSAEVSLARQEREAGRRSQKSNRNTAKKHHKNKGRKTQGKRTKALKKSKNRRQTKQSRRAKNKREEK